MRKNIEVELYHYRKTPLLAQTPVEDRLGFRLRWLHQTSKDSEQVFCSYESSFELFHPPNPKNCVIWTHTVSDVPLCSSSKFQL